MLVRQGRGGKRCENSEQSVLARTDASRTETVRDMMREAAAYISHTFDTQTTRYRTTVHPHTETIDRQRQHNRDPHPTKPKRKPHNRTTTLESRLLCSRNLRPVPDSLSALSAGVNTVSRSLHLCAYAVD